VNCGFMLQEAMVEMVEFKNSRWKNDGIFLIVYQQEI